MRPGFVYMVTNHARTALYIGVTSELVKRAAQHRAGTFHGFTKRYRLNRVVYFEAYPRIDEAIHREKVLKGWTRARKEALILSMNPEWRDLLAPSPSSS